MIIKFPSSIASSSSQGLCGGLCTVGLASDTRTVGRDGLLDDLASRLDHVDSHEPVTHFGPCGKDVIETNRLLRIGSVWRRSGTWSRNMSSGVNRSFLNALSW